MGVFFAPDEILCFIFASSYMDHLLGPNLISNSEHGSFLLEQERFCKYHFKIFEAIVVLMKLATLSKNTQNSVSCKGSDMVTSVIAPFMLSQVTCFGSFYIGISKLPVAGISTISWLAQILNKPHPLMENGPGKCINSCYLYKIGKVWLKVYVKTRLALLDWCCGRPLIAGVCYCRRPCPLHSYLPSPSRVKCFQGYPSHPLMKL